MEYYMELFKAYPFFAFFVALFRGTSASSYHVVGENALPRQIVFATLPHT
jgi:hypothetical protein